MQQTETDVYSYTRMGFVPVCMIGLQNPFAFPLWLSPSRDLYHDRTKSDISWGFMDKNPTARRVHHIQKNLMCIYMRLYKKIPHILPHTNTSCIKSYIPSITALSKGSHHDNKIRDQWCKTPNKEKNGLSNQDQQTLLKTHL